MDWQHLRQKLETQGISPKLPSVSSRQTEHFLIYNVQHDWSETFTKRYFIGPEGYHLFTYIPLTGKLKRGSDTVSFLTRGSRRVVP